MTDQLNRAVDRAVAEPGGSAATAVSTATRPTGSHKAAVRTRVPPVWTSLLSAGYPQQNLIWFTKPNADQQVDRRVPNWHAINYMVSSDIIRTSRQRRDRQGRAAALTAGRSMGLGIPRDRDSQGWTVNRLAAPDVTIVVPTRNEAQNIDPMVRRTAAAMTGAGLTWEMLVVDDSDDDTPARVHRHAAAGLPVRLLHRSFDQRVNGLSGAVSAGFQDAWGDVLAVMDADLQHPPEVLPELVAAVALDDVQIAIASRYCRGAGSERH